jgi:glutamyl-tRNA(Gln) amidotransferase subunit E
VDRLGIPLVEVATGPVMRTPVQVKDVAHTIGLVLRATKKVRRGLGTIRQDLNVSITGGDRVEIKGVQELNAIPFIVQEEVRRQLELIDIREELERRGVGRGEIPSDPVDVTEVLKATSSKVIKRALEVNGKVLGIRLPGLKGLLDGVPANEEGRHVTVGRYRLGAELAAYARTAGVMGIFESDELPGYGITQAEVDALADALGATGEHDAFAIVAEVPEKALAAVAQVIERARLAFDGVPQEVRGVRETRGKDGEEHLTEFQRPMPGAARMYPETDIPPVRVTEDMLDVIDVPEMPDEPLCRSYPDHAAVIARTLLSTIPELAREGICIRDLGMLDPIFKALDEGRFAKEGVPEILWAMIEKGLDLLEALDGLGLSGGPDLAAVRDRIKGVVVENMGLVKERGRGAVGPLMGILMKEFRGKVDGKVLSDILREELDAIDNDAN